MESEADKKHGTGKFVPESVRIVDVSTTNNNLLVRGSSAFGASNFSMSLFVRTIRNAPNYGSDGVNGVKVADDPMIVDFCLIGYGPPNHKDKRIVGAEALWFSSSPPSLDGSAGPYPTLVSTEKSSNVMVYWPVQAIGGTVPCAAGGDWSGANGVDASITGTPNTNFDFAGLIPTVRAALTNSAPNISPSIKNAVIYVHCDSGVNRTGAVVTSYLMQYGSAIAALGIARPASGSFNTLAQAQTAIAIDPPGNDSSPPGGADQPVAEAYCNFLQNSGNAKAPLSANCVPLSGTIANCSP